MKVIITRDEQTMIIKNVTSINRKESHFEVSTGHGKLLKFWDDDGTQTIIISMDKEEKTNATQGKN